MRSWGIGGSCLIVVHLAGCANPLAPLEKDYGRVVRAERTREVVSLELERAPASPASEATTGASPPPSRFAGLDRVSLSLEQCRVSALTHNLDLAAALVDPAIANQRLSREEAAFEALLFLNANQTQTDTPTASTLTSAQQEFTSLEPGVRIPLRTGGRIEVSAPFSRVETNNQFSTLNPSFTADLELTLSQPLLRNAGRFVSTSAIRIASYNRQISEAQTKVRVLGELAAVDRAYWRLYQARQDLIVRQQQYELAMAQLARAERRVAAGDVAEIEVVRAQAGVADRLEDIINAENTVLVRQRDLKRRINMPGLDVDSPQMIETSTPPDPVRFVLDPGALAARAIADRMEVLEQELLLLIDATDVRAAENRLRPLLDATLSYTINGLGSNEGDALDTLAENQFEDWSLALRGELPVGNQAARATFNEAMLNRLRRISTKSSREQTVRQEVYDAADAIDAGWQRVLAARQSVVLNRRALEGEERQFQVGDSTSTDVLDAAARLADAQLAEISALVDYQIAQIDLAAATGSLLGAARVRWEPRSEFSAEASSPRSEG